MRKVVYLGLDYVIMLCSRRCDSCVHVFARAPEHGCTSGARRREVEQQARFLVVSLSLVEFWPESRIRSNGALAPFCSVRSSILRIRRTSPFAFNGVRVELVAILWGMIGVWSMIIEVASMRGSFGIVLTRRRGARPTVIRSRICVVMRGRWIHNEVVQ